MKSGCNTLQGNLDIQHLYNFEVDWRLLFVWGFSLPETQRPTYSMILTFQPQKLRLAYRQVSLVRLSNDATLEPSLRRNYKALTWSAEGQLRIARHPCACRES